MKERNKLAPALAGGLVFILISAIMQTLFSEDPSYLEAILGGIAFAITWTVVSRLLDGKR